MTKKHWQDDTGTFSGVMLGVAMFFLGLTAFVLLWMYFVAGDFDQPEEVAGVTTTVPWVGQVEHDHHDLELENFCLGWVNGFQQAQIRNAAGPPPADWGAEQMDLCVESDPLVTESQDAGLLGLLNRGE